MKRPRRLRATPALRSLVRETTLAPSNFVLPLFVREGKGDARPIASMPGHAQHPVDGLAAQAREARKLGLAGVLLFGLPADKDPMGLSSGARDGVVPRAIRAIRDAAPDLLVATDVCLCAYTDHGHCGVVRDGRVDNDATLPLLADMALGHARAGADIVAPSAMMDGQVAAIRSAVPQTTILSYAAKYASAFYGPFREAADSAPRFGDRATYQMDPANADEAMREIEADLEEGADIVMVKPALAYLDVVRRARDRFACPIAAYNVSGEYAMVKAAAAAGWLDERRAALEVLTSIRRAGAGLIVTYHALEAARWLGA
jgi:porphobilinogen synthase